MNPEPVTRCAVRSGSYYDSIVLMQLQRALTGLPGVLDAGVVMATPANREVLAASGLAPGEEVDAGPNDLLIAVKAESETAAGEALGRVDALLQVRRGGGEEDFRPRSLETALRQLPEARWVLVSVPGRHAAGVAHEALDLGRSVFLYSDNVPLADEVALKSKARERGLFVLGPDCGTAIVGGTGFGFANRVRRGGIGIVAASGTGLQAVAARIHELGGGISQAIGTGGRDLSEEVGGATARQALDLLGRDPDTRAVVLVSKPPSPAVAARLLLAAQRTGKPVIACFLGLPTPLRRLGGISFAVSLSEAAELAVRLATEEPGGEAPEGGTGGFVRGLFSGGTLAYEAQLALEAFLTPIWSNAPAGDSRLLADPLHSRDHTILDLGADEFTVGRLHPMLDQDLRLRRLRQEAADPAVGLILLDVVLGDGAHADPAGELAPAIERALAERGGLTIVALLVGTDEDFQNREEQATALSRAGARVCGTVEEAAWLVWRHVGGWSEEDDGLPVPLDAVRGPVAAVNVGLKSFYDSLVARGAQAVQVDWKPPAGGNEKLAGILSRMKNARH